MIVLTVCGIILLGDSMGIFKSIMAGMGLKQVDEVEAQNQVENISPINNKETKLTEVKQMNVSSLICYAPKTNGEVKQIIDFLKQGEACIVNLSALSSADIKSVLDYLGGAVYALSGTISKLDGNLYVLSPKNINIVAM